MTRARTQWTACVLKLDEPEDEILPYKAYASYSTGKRTIYDLSATIRREDDAWMEARALTNAYNRNAIRPAQCDTRITASKLPAGTLLPEPPPNDGFNEALARMVKLSEDISRPKP